MIINELKLKKSLDKQVLNNYIRIETYSFNKLYHQMFLGKCLMSSKGRYFYTFTTSNIHSNLYIKDLNFVNTYLKIIEEATSTNIEYTFLKTKIIFNINLKDKNLDKNYYNVYRAVVLTRFLTFKQFWLYPLTIIELNKYLDNIEEVLYLTNFIYPTNHYWGLYQVFARFNTRYNIKFINNRLFFNFDSLKTHQGDVMNDFFASSANNVLFDEDNIKFKLHYLLIDGKFQEAAEYYSSLKNKL